MMSVRLRGHALVVEGEGAQAGAVLQARVADHVDDFRAVAQVVQLVEREEAHAGVVGFAAQDAVELDGMADGLVDLQAELRAVEDQVEFALRALIGAQCSATASSAMRGALRQQVAARRPVRSLSTDTGRRRSWGRSASGFRHPCSRAPKSPRR